MLIAKNITKKYLGRTILSNISISPKIGSITTLLGKNGAGKSTLLRILAGHESAELGSVTYKDTELSNPNFPFVHDIAFIHEQLNFDLPYSMNQFICNLKPHLPKWDQDLFQKMILDTKFDIYKLFNQCSRGQKMQFVLMMTLASNPKIILIDEITSVIDVFGRKYFLELLATYAKLGGTVVITTNIIDELEHFTDQIIILKDEELVLNNAINDLPQLFVKIRKGNNQDHAIFKHQLCIWGGTNSDKSVTYIVPKNIFEDLGSPEYLLDKRKTTLEDLFMYYFSVKKKHEIAS